MKLNVLTFIFFSMVAAACIAGPTTTQAASISELRDMIFDRNKKIEELEKEIQTYEGELREVGREKQTLQTALGQLDLSRKKIGADISLTQNKIGSADLTINQLAIEIEEKESLIEQNKAAIGETLRTMHELESDSMIETILTHEHISDVWDQMETIQRVQLAMRDDVETLTTLKDELQGKKSESEAQKQELARYKQELDGKKRVLDENRQETDQLLSATQNKEANYQALLAEKRAAYEKFQQELQNFEAQLQFAIDPASIPATGQGVLGWPLANLSVTQYFGNTAFAQGGAYNGNGHNGMDFRASVGTPILASLSGTVQGAGNTDSIPGCYSYGKWVLIKHNNGLSTLYAHLSVISVNEGQTVSTGDIVGYSGNTGYSTGPHLHFTVYLSEAVKVQDLASWYRSRGLPTGTGCATARIPVSPLEGYLNPLDYLTDADKLR